VPDLQPQLRLFLFGHRALIYSFFGANEATVRQLPGSGVVGKLTII
jgi:hypothetical protein